MKKRLLSILLMCCMVLTLLPTAAFAEGSEEELPVCTCETACTADFPLERKLEIFLTLALRGYKVPEEAAQQVLAFLGGLDIRGIAQKVMEELFRQLAMRYEFSPDGLLPPEKYCGARQASPAADGAGEREDTS